MRLISSGNDAVENLPERILTELATRDEGISSLQLAELLQLDHQRVIGAIKSLEAQALKVRIHYTLRTCIPTSYCSLSRPRRERRNVLS